MKTVNNHRLVLAGMLALLLFSRCSKTVIPKGQQFYGYDDGSSTAKMAVFESSSRISAEVKEDGDAILLTLDSSGLGDVTRKANLPDAQSAIYKIPDSRAISVVPKFFYSQKEAARQPLAPSSLRFHKRSLYLQGIAIPLKFRAAAANISSQAESGPSIAFAPGYKFSTNWFTGSPDLLGHNTRSLSLGVGGLIGVGITDIKAASTNGKILDVDATKNAIVPVGFHVVAGYNKVNVGLAFGTDIITGPNSDAWIYKGKWWTGIIVGLDILK